jgi:hypothetical protein
MGALALRFAAVLSCGCGVLAFSGVALAASIIGAGLGGSGSYNTLACERT